jgi:hypothetical protein
VAPFAAGGVVDEAHDAENALAVDHPLAAADCVAGELDWLVGLAGAPGLGDGWGRHDAPPFQVALLP